MKYLSVLLLCLSLPGFAQQDAKRDSFLNLAATAVADTDKVWAIMNAGKLYSVLLPDTALVYFNRALALSEKIKFEPGIAKCRINRSVALDKLGHFQECVTDCKAAVVICEKLGMKKELVAAYNNLGNAWDFLGNRWLAIDAFSKALTAMEGVDLPPYFPLTVRNNIARQYNDVHLYEKGYAYGKKSLEEATALGDSIEIAAALQVMVFADMKMDRLEEAFSFCQRIERISRGVDPSLLVFSLHNMAVMSIDDNPLKSEEMAREALSIARSMGNLSGEVGALFLLARLSIYNKDPKSAKEYAEEAMAKARKEHLNDDIARLYLTQSDIALMEGNIRQFREMRELYEAAKDTLSNATLQHATQELETKYETEKKEQQIALQQLKLRQKNRFILGLAAFSVLLLMAAFLVFRNLRQRRLLTEQELMLQKQQIRQLKQEQQLTVADAMLRSQEDERSRLARDLHDGLGGMLSGVKQSLNAMKGNQILSETSATALGQVINDLDRSITELRHIARNMMPEALVRFGLKDALQDYCDHLRLNSTLSIHYQVYGLDNRLPQQTEVILFRIAQELLNNVLKHADAKKVLVQLMENDGNISLTVEDDGTGFDPEKLNTAPGVGWLNIRSRVEYLNGTIDLHSTPGKGTSINIEFPVS